MYKSLEFCLLIVYNKLKAKKGAFLAMNEHIELGKELLKILIGKGCEAYMIGEAVCYYILGLPIREVEIATSATAEMVKGIFQDYRTEDENGYVRLYYRGYDFLIGTFKRVDYRDDRTPLRMHYSKNLHDEVSARDFTINSIAMSPAEKYTDIYRGYEDLQKKRIKTIGNPKTRFEENPLRILTAFRFVSELGFKIEKRTFNAMRKKAKLLLRMSPEAMVKEMKRILEGDHFKKALFLLVDSGIYKRIPVLKHEFKRLRNKYRPETTDIFLGCAFVKAGEFNAEWGQASEDPARLAEIVDLALANPKGNFNSEDLFFKGLDICLEANRINRLLNKSKKKDKQIQAAFENLPIKTADELAFSKNDLKYLLKSYDAYDEIIYENILRKVLLGELANNYQEIRNFAFESLKTYYGEAVAQNLSAEPAPAPTVAEEPPQQDFVHDAAPEIPVYHDGFQNPGSESLEEKVRRLELQNLELELNRVVDNLTAQNIEILAELGYVRGAEKILVTRELNRFYRNLLTSIDPKYQALKKYQERIDSK
jgi:tRNA nucleotidyltransferase (CCA-adding enzyme)